MNINRYAKIIFVSFYKYFITVFLLIQLLNELSYPRHLT